MPSYELTLRHISEKARVILCLLVNRLLLLHYVLVVGHNIKQIRPAPLVNFGAKIMLFFDICK